MTNLDNYSKFKFSSQVGKNSFYVAFFPHSMQNYAELKTLKYLESWFNVSNSVKWKGSLLISP